MNISDQEQVIFTQDTVRSNADTSAGVIKPLPDTIRTVNPVPGKKVYPLQFKELPATIDTISVCKRNPVSDVTFYDSANIVTRISSHELNGFPYSFIEKTREREERALQQLTSHLKNGKELPVKPFHNDWIIAVVLLASFIYSSIRTFSKNFFPEVARYFSFRGVGDPSSYDISALFHWQSTLINLISFLNIALFTCYAAFYYDFIPAGISGFVFWLIAFVIVSAIITIRHLICYFIGKLSGEVKAFNEYITAVYQSFRYTALILFILVILLSYTGIFEVKSLFIAGFFSFFVLYFIRIVRLLLIFIKRNISVLYLILYLCALEILPVLILVKYFTGLF